MNATTEKGLNWPERAKLADALGVEVKDLAPDITAATVDREYPEVKLTSRLAGGGVPSLAAIGRG